MKNKGVTMIELVIVVLILIILAVIAIWSSNKPSMEAEAVVIYSELESVYRGVIHAKENYETYIIDEYKAGEQYNETYKNEAGEEVKGWYVIYGLDNPSLYNEEVIENIGVSELKRSYKVNFDEMKVEFLNGPVKLGDYQINSYEDIKELKDSGVI